MCGRQVALKKKKKLCFPNTAPIHESRLLYHHYRLAIYIMLSAAILFQSFFSLIFYRHFSSDGPVMEATSQFLYRVRLRLNWQGGPGAGHRHGLVRFVAGCTRCGIAPTSTLWTTTVCSPVPNKYVCR